ncbi:MAG: DUF3786 domain-containing protein [Candidatus Lindowbacteria bacterium]|nr:DUF3786 domain-containing protein [Candidatus Lindowbacteria bacterium]
MQKPAQNTYEEARKLAWVCLRQRDPDKIARDGFLFHEEGTKRIVVPFLADRYFVDMQSQKVFFENGAEVFPFLSVLLLHYLVGVDETPLANEWISFREFDGGNAYFGSFNDRSLAPLKNVFGNQPDLLPEVARQLGAEPLDFGDVGVRVAVFPKVPVAVVMWRGDSEFPPDANILFDKTANHILRTEDLAICGALTVSKLRKNAEKLKKA